MRVEKIKPEIIEPPAEWHIILSEAEAKIMKRLAGFLTGKGIDELSKIWPEYDFHDRIEMDQLMGSILTHLYKVEVSWPTK